MPQVHNITVYGSKSSFQIPHNIVPPLSSWSIQVQITLEEAQAEYTVFQIDPHNQPDWYVAKVNPARKVSTRFFVFSVHIHTRPRSSHPDSSSDIRRPEGAPRGPLAGIRQDRGVARDPGVYRGSLPGGAPPPDGPRPPCKGALLYQRRRDEVIPAFLAFVFRSGAVDDLLASAEALQALLPPTSGYAVGAWSIADAAFAPFLAALTLALENEIGTYVEGEGRKTADILRSAKFARLQRYLKDLKARPSFQKTWAEAEITEKWKKDLARK